MFGSRRKKKNPTIDWPTLQALLEDDDQRAAIEYTYPTKGRDSFLTATRRVDASVSNRLIGAGKKVHTAERLVEWPTVAVAGMLNSGKTSLVATFLSESGQTRTLRGTNNSQGTHRFVLWLPAAWEQDSELWALLMERIGDTLGEKPEILSTDPVKAHQQYNNQDGNEALLAIPLIATDPALNQAGIALLDCPDIVSDASLGLGSPEARRELLGKAASLCSAFLVVTSAESSRDSTLSDMLRIASDLMPGVPRMLAVNKVRARQTPDQVHETFQPLALSHGIETIFAAYDFDVPSSGPYIPKLGEGDMVEQGTEQLPVFFSISPDANDNPPACISEERLLESLPTKLDRAQLFEKFNLALAASLRNVIWEDAFVMLDRDATAARRATEKARECLLNSALEFFAQREPGGEVVELRLYQSERILRQLTDSFAANAPWYARIGVRINSRVRAILGGAKDWVKGLMPSELARKFAENVKEKIRRGEYGGVMTPETLCNALQRNHGAASLPHWKQESVSEEDSAWIRACADAIRRFEREDFTSLDADRLNDSVKELWKNVPVRKKLKAGLTPLAAILATFGAVLLIPVDFTGGGIVCFCASLSELLTAGGISAAISISSVADQSTKNVGQQAARQQLANFHAILCDTFGIARNTDPCLVRVAARDDKLIPSKLAVREAIQHTLPLYQIRSEFQKDLQRSLPRNSPSSP